MMQNKFYEEWYYCKGGQDYHKKYKEKRKGLFLYIIIDPNIELDKSILYVGSTTDIIGRYNRHVSVEKIKELEDEGFKPKLFVMDLTNYIKSVEELKDVEQYLINLVNKINKNNHNVYCYKPIYKNDIEKLLQDFINKNLFFIDFNTYKLHSPANKIIYLDKLLRLEDCNV